MKNVQLTHAALFICFSHGGSAAPVPAQAAKQKIEPSKVDRLYDFKGVPLGISLDDFRAHPHPDGIAAKVVCDGEKIPTIFGEEEASRTKIYDDIEKEIGVRKCIYAERREDGKGFNAPASLKLADSGFITSLYSFNFIKDPKDGILRLYRFECIATDEAMPYILSGMSAKFGDPKLSSSSVQSRAGATFPQTTAEWLSASASLTIQDRWTKIDNMGVVMEYKRLAEIESKARAAKKAATPNAI